MSNEADVITFLIALALHGAGLALIWGGGLWLTLGGAALVVAGVALLWVTR